MPAAATAPRPTPAAATDQPKAQPNQQNYERDLHQATDQHEWKEEEREAMVWAATPVPPTFKLPAWPSLILRAELPARPSLILRAELPARIELAFWIGLALRARPGLISMRPKVAPAVRLHTATEGHKQR
jgi:hypothetical protein